MKLILIAFHFYICESILKTCVLYKMVGLLENLCDYAIIQLLQFYNNRSFRLANDGLIGILEKQQGYHYTSSFGS